MKNNIQEELKTILFNAVIKNTDNTNGEAIFNGHALLYMKKALKQAYNLGCQKRKKITL